MGKEVSEGSNLVEGGGGDSATLETQVVQAQEGDRESLEMVVSRVHDLVCRLSLRFLGHPQDAEDATQEILLRIVTRLSTFRGESAFTTWVYRVASNRLLTLRAGRAEAGITVEEFEEDLGQGLSSDPPAAYPGVEKALLLEELKIACTTAMLLCLDRKHRLAYILGEILEMDHGEAADVAGISPANHRKRLSRARAVITGLMKRRCGLFEPSNPCRCWGRLDRAVDLERVDPERLVYAGSLEQARRFPRVLDEIRRLEELSRSAALYRSHSGPRTSWDGAAFLDGIVGEANRSGDRQDPAVDNRLA